jgi:16S rRNA A1518/A1519 N6-dimethyltransferase RsmA/KsgA/DIM1 with predicted DNA glycosylase/AP lyase activity
VGLSGSRNRLTSNMDIILNVRSSDTKVNNTPYNITSRILKRITISGSKVNMDVPFQYLVLLDTLADITFHQGVQDTHIW